MIFPVMRHSTTHLKVTTGMLLASAFSLIHLGTYLSPKTTVASPKLSSINDKKRHEWISLLLFFPIVLFVLWPSLFFLSFKYTMYDHKKKHQFSDFFLNFCCSNRRNRREIRTVTDSFEIYIINSLMKKKNWK